MASCGHTHKADKPTAQSAPLPSCLSEATCHIGTWCKVLPSHPSQEMQRPCQEAAGKEENNAHALTRLGLWPQANKERFAKLRDKMSLERKEKEEAAKREAAERRVKEDAELRMRRVAEQQAAHGAPLQHHQFRLHPQCVMLSISLAQRQGQESRGKLAGLLRGWSNTVVVEAEADRAEAAGCLGRARATADLLACRSCAALCA